MNANNKPVFVVTLDAYGIADTIERDGIAISSNTRDAQRILRSLENGKVPDDVVVRSPARGAA